MNTTGDGNQARDAADLYDDLLRASRAHAAAATRAAGDVPAAKLPARRLFVLTCMDARVDPLRMLGLRPGDAHVVRNAGGRVTDDVVRSLVLSSALLGTRHVAVVHHTDCGLLAPGDAHVRAQLRERGVDVEGFLRRRPSVRQAYGLQGTRWGGQTFYTRKALARWLERRGAAYRKWARKHPAPAHRMVK